MAVGPNQSKIMSISTTTLYPTAWVITFTAPYIYYDAGLGPIFGFAYAGTIITSLMRVPARKWRTTTFQVLREDDDDNKAHVGVDHVDDISRKDCAV
ncbi:general substrate transporter [Penicillium robsamsonii]|uniref:general substrate transporter n=1 Tax=Penicillium robsamsonii TaxID=1792511 RepID=UPI002548612D|nr:general substrate transporter [Penicillium robsamsonii]KAJ5827414.1 general substrate transporter [Penicillium robsamsonii]